MADVWKRWSWVVKVTLIVMYANIYPPRYWYEFIDKQTWIVIFCPKAVRKYALERIPPAGLLDSRIEHDSRCNFQAPLQFPPPTATHSRLVSDTPDRKTKPITHTYTHRQRSKRIATRNLLKTHATHEGASWTSWASYVLTLTTDKIAIRHFIFHMDSRNKKRHENVEQDGRIDLFFLV